MIGVWIILALVITYKKLVNIKIIEISQDNSTKWVFLLIVIYMVLIIIFLILIYQKKLNNLRNIWVNDIS